MPSENHMAIGVDGPPFYGPDATAEEKAKFWEEHKAWRRLRNTCASCGSSNVEVRNHSAIWGDGDVFCENGHYVRMWDSG